MAVNITWLSSFVVLPPLCSSSYTRKYDCEQQPNEQEKNTNNVFNAKWSEVKWRLKMSWRFPKTIADKHPAAANTCCTAEEKYNSTSSAAIVTVAIAVVPTPSVFATRRGCERESITPSSQHFDSVYSRGAKQYSALSPLPPRGLPGPLHSHSELHATKHTANTPCSGSMVWRYLFVNTTHRGCCACARHWPLATDSAKSSASGISSQTNIWIFHPPSMPGQKVRVWVSFTSAVVETTSVGGNWISLQSRVDCYGRQNEKNAALCVQLNSFNRIAIRHFRFAFELEKRARTKLSHSVNRLLNVKEEE